MINKEEKEILAYIDSFEQGKCNDLSKFNADIINKLKTEELIIEMLPASSNIFNSNVFNADKEYTYFALSEKAKNLLS